MSIPIAKQYIKDFEQLGLGMFVHFGLYSMIGRGEWIADRIKMPQEEYAKLAESFNPKGFEELVLEAKNAGAKYITLTTKHHDGFCLFDSCGLTEFDAPHSAAKRDLIREFVDTCRKHDIVPFFYYATYEFWNDDFYHNFDKYLQYLRDSVEILCKNYGEIGGLWFDGNWAKKDCDWQEGELYAVIRKHQPNAMIINNTGLSKLGQTGHPEIDCVTFERGRPTPLDREGAEKYITGEMCDSINFHWGLAKDFNFKSPKTLLEQLCVCRKVGANFLLNVGPEADGSLDVFPKAILQTIGKWMDMFGESIYDGRPYWYHADTKNFVLESEKQLYFFCFDLCRKGSANVVYLSGTEGEFTFQNFGYQFENLHWMDNEEALESRWDGNDLIINFTGFDYGIDYCVRVAKADKI